MPLRSARILITGCLLILTTMVLTSPALAGYKLVAGPAPDDPMGVSIYQLDNGLTVYLTVNHETPRFYAEIVVRAGHKQDPPENTGLAHYLEHLLFKGNALMGTTDFESEKPHIDRITSLYEERFNETDPVRRAELYNEINAENQASAAYAVPNEFGNTYKQLGASGLNAHTWYEETVYKVGLPANRLAQWCQIESDRFIDPVFRLFVTELEVVYEEKNRAMDDKGRITNEAMFNQLFKVHPYGQQTTLGEVEHLKNPSLKSVREYYDTYYVPNNMAIIISGSINPDETIQMIDQHFSRWQAKELPEPRVYEEVPLAEREQVTIGFDAEPYMLMGYRIAGRNHEDADALMLADMVLSNRSTGMIDLNMVQNQMIQSAGSSPTLQNDYGWQVFWATPKERQTLDEAEELLQEQIERVKQGDFDDDLLSGIIAVFEKGLKRSIESDKGRVTLIRNSFVAGQDWSYSAAQLDRMSQLSKEDVVRVANKYYSDGYVVAYRVQGQHEVPEITKPAIDTIQIDPTRQSPYAQQVLAMPVVPIEPTYIEEGRDYTVTEYAPGVDLFHTPNPINDLFSLSFVIDEGTRHDKTLGMAAQLFNQAGVGQRSPEAMKKAWFALGTHMSFSTSPNRTIITISGLDENLDASLALLMEALREPTAEQQVLSDMVENTISRRQQNKKSHKTIASAIRQLSRYGDKSKYIDTLSDEALRALTTEGLFAKATSLLDTKHTIRYTGSLPPERVMSALQSHHPVAGDLKDPPQYVSREMRVPEQNEVRFYHKQMAQSLIYIDQPGVFYNESLMPLPDIFNRYFGGMGGVAYQELREARALAYVVGGGYFAASRPDERNSAIGKIGCQADKSIDATEGMVGVFNEMPLSEDQFAKAKKALISSYRTSKIGFRSVAESVDAWAQLGLTGDPRAARFQVLQEADMATLTDFYNNEVKGHPKYITIVGDSDKIDLDMLGTLGEVVEVELDALFGY
jgi:zinc protease